MAVFFNRLVCFELLSLFSFAFMFLNDAQLLATDGSELQIEGALNLMMDEIIEDLLTRYDNIKSDDFWHPYEFGSVGDDRRETSPVFEQSMGLYGLFMELSKRMNTWREVVSEAENTLSKKINVDGDNIVTGEWKVKTISADDVSVEGRDARSEDVFNILRFGKVLWTEDDFASTNEHILDKMEDMDSKLIVVHEKLSNALRKSFTGRQIVSTKIIMSGILEAESAEINNYNGNNLWNRDAQQFFNSLAHEGQDVKIVGGLSFTDTLITKNIRTKTINGVTVTDIARRSADNKFECGFTFDSVESVHDINAGTVNSLNFAESVVMADDIHGLTLTDGVVAYDGVETVEPLQFDNVLLRGTPQTVTSTIMFRDVQINSPVSVGSLNDADFQFLSERIVLKTFQGKIKGTKLFPSGTAVETFFMSSWNGLDFPNEFFTPFKRNIELTEPKSFSKLNTDELFVDGMVDGINVANLVTLSNAEEIESTWIFNGPSKIQNDIKVQRTVDSIFMESLIHQGILDSSTQLFSPNADIIFQQPVHIEKLHVEEAINNKDFDELFGNVLLFEGKACSVPGTTTVMGDVVFRNINLKGDKINGFSIQHFLTKDTKQRITRPVILSGSASFQELVTLDRFDSVQVLDVLSKAMRITKVTASTVPWDVHFEAISCQQTFTVQGPVNSMANYKNAVARTRGLSSQTFLGSIILNRPVMKSLSTVNLMIDNGHALQTLDVNEWNIARAKLSEPAIFLKPFIANTILISSNFDIANVNGFRVEDLEDKVFRKSSERQTFSGPMRITKGFSMLNGEVNFFEKVDGFFLDDFVHHGFPLNAENDKPIVLSKHWRFESLELNKGIQMDGTNVCGVNLENIFIDSVRKSQQFVEVSGEKSFIQPLEVRRSLTSSHINGKSTREIFQLKKDNQEIKELATFTSDVIKEKLSVDSINNVQVSWLSKMHSFRDGQHVLNHDVLIKGHLQTNSLLVNGKTQNVELNQFLSETIKHSDVNIQFQNPVFVERPILSNKDVKVNFYNDINMKHLMDGVVFANRDLVVEQLVSFPGGIRSNPLTVGGNLKSANLANGLDWDSLKNNAIRITDENVEMETNNLIFDHLVITAPAKITQLNGINFQDFVTVNSPQDVGTLKVHNALFNTSNVVVKGNIGSFKIRDEFKDTLMVNADDMQRMTGAITIKGPIQVKSDLECFGPLLKERVFTTQENLLLKGPIEFTQPVVIKKDVKVTKPIQGHSADSLFSDAFSTDSGKGEQMISGLWEFRGPVTFVENVSGQGLGNKANIQALVQEKEKELHEAHRILTEEHTRFKRNCVSLQEIQNEMSTYPVKLDSFDLHQVISAPAQAENVITVGTGRNEGNSYLLLQTVNCQLHRYQWHPTTELFHRIVEPTIVIGSVQSWESISTADESTIVVIAKKVSECSPQPGLFVMSTSSNGDMSPMSTISGLPVKSFKLAKSSENAKVMLFAIFDKRSNELNVFEWTDEKFIHKTIIRFSSPMERVDVTPTPSGMGILCHNKGEVHMYQYSPSGNNKVLLEGTRTFQASNTAPLSVFQNFDTIFALVPEAGNTPALIQPTCNFQVMRFLNGGQVESLQKLQVPEVMSATHWTFSKKNFIAFLSKSHGLTIYKFMGLNGFQTISSPSRVFDGFMLKAFTLKRSEFAMPQPFLMTLSSNRIEVYRGNIFGDKFTSDFQDLCKS